MHLYRRLDVWRRAHAVAVQVVQLCARSRGEAARDIASQLRRAAISVPANIAEGAGSASPRMFARYVAIALASAHELEAILEIAADAEALPKADVARLIAESTAVRAMLFRLRQRLLTPLTRA
jgi:four helix bundle protein